MGKGDSRKKIFHQCATFSLFWSLFYLLRVVIYVISHRNKTVDEEVEWQILQGMLSVMGLLTSLSMFNAYKQMDAHSKFLIGSWIFWMFANLTISLFLLHISLFELYTVEKWESLRFYSEAIDLIHIVNAPGCIYFILIFMANSCIQRPQSSDVLFGTMKTPLGYERLSKFEVLHVAEGLEDDEIVYYV